MFPSSYREIPLHCHRPRNAKTMLSTKKHSSFARGLQERQRDIMGGNKCRKTDPFAF